MLLIDISTLSITLILFFLVFLGFVIGLLPVRVLDEDNLTHVRMSLRARTSASDLWLAVIKCL